MASALDGPARSLVTEAGRPIEGLFRQTSVRRRCVDPSEFFTWDDFSRIANRSEVRRHLLLNGNRRSDPSTDDVIHGVREGATLLIENVERVSAKMARLCGDLCRALGGEFVRCNVYMAPSTDHMGFGMHHDVVDAFIVQIAGEKHWRVWPPTLPDPVWIMKDHDQEIDEASPALDVVLCPGDVLYLRRGDPHGAQCASKSGPSLHLTIGVHGTTGEDVLQWLLGESSDRAEFRSSWPIEVRPLGGVQPLDDAGPDRLAWIAELRTHLRGWIDTFSDAELLNQFLNFRAASRTTVGWLNAPDGIGDAAVASGTSIRPSHALRYGRLHESALYSKGITIKIPERYLRLVCRLQNEGAATTAADLGAELSMTASDVLVFTRELARLGLVEVAGLED